ncbi:MAG: Na(+)/H(+) antiporter subunit D [Rhodobiaceae bacterium]|jgi:multicomponent Na+:H+ antiporter subunit D|nr:Na(+)/H(+) antiporter subunit D [Rhodobiaceae bacterium]MBT5518326.1 Na(+)/H(+) antiporter subunit D [Rhodobiaceae bacterium]
MLDMLVSIPGLSLILGALLVPVLPHGARQAYMLALIAVSGYLTFGIETGVHTTARLGGLDLILVRAEAITKPFALVFHLAAALNVVYALHETQKTTATAGLAYAGAAIAALFAGDFLTLFLYWELTAVTSVFLVLAGNRARALSAAMRYLLMQVGSGVILLAGAVMLWRDGTGLSIQAIDALTPAGLCVLLAFGIKAAFPLVNGWLQDAYPEASVTGTVMLSAFTTKLAIYMLALCFAGFTPLIYIGAVMAVLPIFFAALETDLRRVLAYSLNNQLGFMVIGIGIGTQLAINGTVAHAFASTIYQGLLFMALGAVLHRTGTVKANELGGLWKTMPLTAIFCSVGALSIISFPLFSGFVTKSLTLGAVAKEGYFWVWLAMVFATVGAVQHVFIKAVYLPFFGPDRKLKAQEAPLGMLIAMAAAAALCLGLGVYPEPLYALLPYAARYEVWKAGYVLGELQLLTFAGLGFAILSLRGLYPAAIDTSVLNTDWLWRRALPRLTLAHARPVLSLWFVVLGALKRGVLRALKISEETSRESGLVSGVASIGSAAGIFLAMFALMLLLRQVT